MLVCPNCNHNNPDGATQCEACFTALPQSMPCPHCNAPVQTDATFCGNCGNTISAVTNPLVTLGQEEAKSPDEGAIPASSPPVVPQATQLQTHTPYLLHVGTQIRLDFPQGLTVIHIGKPNENIPPDLDVSGFPHSDIVSRVHADIRVEGDAYYLEDVGSANGTYVNHSPLPKGNRHRLQSGDRLALGKGDLMTFLFQLS